MQAIPGKATDRSHSKSNAGIGKLTYRAKSIATHTHTDTHSLAQKTSILIQSKQTNTKKASMEMVRMEYTHFVHASNAQAIDDFDKTFKIVVFYMHKVHAIVMGVKFL